MLHGVVEQGHEQTFLAAMLPFPSEANVLMWLFRRLTSSVRHVSLFNKLSGEGINTSSHVVFLLLPLL